MMAMWSMRKQKFIDQLSRKISGIVKTKTIEKIKNKKNGRLAAILAFFVVKFVMGYLCVRHYILFYINGPVILHFLS